MNIVSPNFSDLLKPNVEIKKFADGDNYICILDAVEQGDNITFFNRLYPEQDRNLIKSMFILKTLKSKKCNITMVVPYLPYSRQDKAWKPGEPISAKHTCEMLAWAGVKKLITFDCHFLKKQGNFEKWDLNIENISMSNRLIEYAKKNYLNGGDLEVVSPDLGASYMTGGGKSMKKMRGEYNEGEEAYRKIKEIEMDFEVKGKNILIIDDMISGGGTMIKAIEKLRKSNAKKIICCATHGFFLKNSLEKLQSLSDGVFVSNTIPSEVSKVNLMDELK